MNSDLLAELARRELARRYYSEYLAYSYLQGRGLDHRWLRQRIALPLPTGAAAERP